jgi:tRNA A37 methylthiotransferase MiaB
LNKLKPGRAAGFCWDTPKAKIASDSCCCQAVPLVPSRRMNPDPASTAPSSPSKLARPAQAPKTSFHSLGCPKALADSEQIIGRLRAEGHELAKTHQDVAAVIVDRGRTGSGVGRTTGDAPEIDGKVHLVPRRPLRQGDIVTVKIERADAYDLHGIAIQGC